VFPSTEDGNATPSFPEAMTVEMIDVLEQASALMFRALRRNAQRFLHAQDAGTAEYDSWAAGTIEYDSWSAGAATGTMKRAARSTARRARMR
jgi:hypothetical protein